MLLHISWNMESNQPVCLCAPCAAGGWNTTPSWSDFTVPTTLAPTQSPTAGSTSRPTRIPDSNLVELTSPLYQDLMGYGYGVSVSANGSQLFIGAPYSRVNVRQSSCAIWVRVQQGHGRDTMSSQAHNRFVKVASVCLLRVDVYRRATLRLDPSSCTSTKAAVSLGYLRRTSRGRGTTS